MRWMMNCSGSSASVQPILRICYFPEKRLPCVQHLLPESAQENGIDFENFAFTPKEEILIEYGQAIAEDPKHVPEELFAKLKANFTEEEIVVITAMGVMMIANNYFNDILDVTPDKLV